MSSQPETSKILRKRTGAAAGVAEAAHHAVQVQDHFAPADVVQVVGVFHEVQVFVGEMQCGEIEGPVGREGHGPAVLRREGEPAGVRPLPHRLGTDIMLFHSGHGVPVDAQESGILAVRIVFHRPAAVPFNLLEFRVQEEPESQAGQADVRPGRKAGVNIDITFRMDLVNDGVRDEGCAHRGLQGGFNPKDAVLFPVFEAGYARRGLAAAVADVAGAVVADEPVAVERRTAQTVQDLFPVQTQADELAEGLIETDADAVVLRAEEAVLLQIHFQRPGINRPDSFQSRLTFIDHKLFRRNHMVAIGPACRLFQFHFHLKGEVPRSII